MACFLIGEEEHKHHKCGDCENFSSALNEFPCATCFGGKVIPIAPAKQCNWKSIKV